MRLAESQRDQPATAIDTASPSPMSTAPIWRARRCGSPAISWPATTFSALPIRTASPAATTAATGVLTLTGQNDLDAIARRHAVDHLVRFQRQSLEPDLHGAELPDNDGTSPDI